MEFIIHACLLIVTFYLISFISDNYFVKALERISEKLKLSSEVTGATFMAIGSSAPELFTSIFTIFSIFGTGENENIGSGTIIGSAIFNILVIVGLSLFFSKKNKKLHRQPIIRDLLFYSITVIILIWSFWDGKIVFIESCIFVVFYFLYIYIVSQWGKRLNYNVDNINENKEEKEKEKEKKEEGKEEGKEKINSKKEIKIKKILDFLIPNPQKNCRFSFIISICIIGILAYKMVDSAIILSQILGISKTIVGLTVLAAGTSAPDAISSIIVAKKGKISMSFSNAIGSNIFDILFGLGSVYFVYFLVYGINNSINIDNHNLFSSMMLLFASIALIIIVLIVKKRKTNKTIGILLLSAYVIYILYMIYRIS